MLKHSCLPIHLPCIINATRLEDICNVLGYLIHCVFSLLYFTHEMVIIQGSMVDMSVLASRHIKQHLSVLLILGPRLYGREAHSHEDMILYVLVLSIMEVSSTSSRLPSRCSNTVTTAPQSKNIEICIRSCHRKSRVGSRVGWEEYICE